jgi:hypothetical protein
MFLANKETKTGIISETFAIKAELGKNLRPAFLII